MTPPLTVRASVTHREREHTFDRPTSEMSHLNNAVRDAKLLGPIGATLRFASPSNHVRNAAVAALAFACVPAAILRRVVSRVVLAFKRVFGARLRAHVLNESGKAVAPAFTDRDASASVVLKAWAFRIRAALDHVCPSPMNWGLVQAASTSHGPSVTTLGGGVNWR